MSWRVVAKREALDPYYSGSLWVYLAVFVLLFGLGTYAGAGRGGELAGLLQGAVYGFVPLIALALGYDAVAERRQNGALRVDLALPHSRRDVVIGTAVGRGLVVAAGITAGYLTAVVVYLVEAGLPTPGLTLLGWLLAVLFGVTVVEVAVGISAGVATTNRAVLGAFGSLLLFFVFWRQLPGAVRYALNGFAAPAGPPPEWAIAFTYIEPLTAYRTTMMGLLPGSAPTQSSVYTTPWFGVLVLVAWLVVPLLVGTRRFEASDL